MSLAEFFESEALTLPKRYGDEGFENAVTSLFNSCPANVMALDSGNDIAVVLKSSISYMAILCSGSSNANLLLLAV